jgi:putative ABC transport system permease protein
MTEYAVLRAMGYQQSFFWMLIGNIAAGFVILAYIPSLIITIFLYRIAAESTQLPINLKLHDAILILMLVVGMGAVSAAVSIRKLRKANPVELFS